MPFDNSEPFFLGRDAELTQVRDFLTTLGPGTMVVRGERGAGKTALINHALRQLKSANQPVAHVSMHGTAKWSELYPILATKFGAADFHLPQTEGEARFQVEKLLRNVRGILILEDFDSLDSNFASELLNLAFRQVLSPDLKVVIITRRAPLLGTAGQDYHSLEIRALDPATVIRERLAKLGRNIEPKLASKLVQLSDNDPHILELIVQNLARLGDAPLPERGKPEKNIAQLLNRLIDSVSAEAREVLQLLGRFETMRVEDVGLLFGPRKRKAIQAALTELHEMGFIREEAGGYRLHSAIKDYIAKYKQVTPAPGMLLVSFDADVISRDEVVNLLLSLNRVYQGLGGDELVIRDETVGLVVAKELQPA